MTQSAKTVTKPLRADSKPRHVRRLPAAAPPASLTDTAYEEVKRRIITLKYPPGSYINEAQLCADLGIGRTPVHQAVNRLSLEGMINIIPRKGNIVRPISLEDALAVFEVRLMLEPACVRLAAELASSDELDAMEKLLEPAPGLIARRDIEALMNIDKDFHIMMARAAHNKVLEQILMRLHERSLRFWFLSLSDRSHVVNVVDEHHEMVEMLRRRDGAAAEAVMRQHIEAARDRIRRSA